MTKMHLIAQFLILLQVIGGSVVWLCECSNTSSYVCIEAERNALIKFKQSFFEDPSGMLSSWGGVNCCDWKGIGCDSNTGNVIKVSLPGTSLSSMQANKLDSSLLQLRHLNHLDLSENNFNAIPVPEFLGKMKGLEYLDLSYANFTPGTFPKHLGNFTSLQALNLSDIDLSEVHNLLPMLNKLPSLTVLDLSWCQLANAQLSPAYSNLTFLSSLQELRLGYNSLGSPFPRLLKNMTSLSVLDLSYNKLSNELPTWLNGLKKLQHLDLSRNKFSRVEGGLLSFLSGLCHLKTFDFSGNYYHQGSFESNTIMSRGCITYDLEALNMRSSGLTGTIPDELCQFKKLAQLDLSNNTLHGPIPASIGHLTALIELKLGGNELNDTIPASLGNLSALQLLDLSSNHLHGAIPTTVGNLPALQYLDLSSNQLNSVVPDSIGQLVSLVWIDISRNYLTSNIDETHFLNVTKLETLDFSSNELTINVAPGWIPPFQLRLMYIRSCKIGGAVFPRWLGTQKEMKQLSLSNASISGPWPKWFKSSALVAFDLSHNEISRQIPRNVADILPALLTLQLSDNSLSGTIPSSLCNMNMLEILDISRNMLSGEIPMCMEDMQSLTIMKLSFNKLTGFIPSNVLFSWLSLNNNRFNGVIPSSLRNCRVLRFLNLGDNGFSGTIPTWIGDMTHLQVLVMRNNRFGGEMPMQLCHMLSLQILDLAGNNLTGSIPRCIGHLTGMTTEHSIVRPPSDSFHELFQAFTFYIGHEWAKEDLVVTMKGNWLRYRNTLQAVVIIDLSRNNFVGIVPEELTLLSQLLGLNLSHNHLSGTIPENIGNLTSLQSLDLSSNQMFGNIPAGLSIPTLGYLNLSHNNFSGQIPTGTQLQTFTDLSVYDGNPNLCGTPLPRRCPRPEHEEENHDDQDDKFDKVWLYIAISCGYGVGIWAVFGILMFKKEWRYAYFQYMDYAIDRLYILTVVNARRLKRKMTGSAEE